MTVKVLVKEILAKDLRPGDLFTVMPQDYWDFAMNLKGVGEAIYVRTNMTADAADDADAMVFRVLIEVIEEDDHVD